MGQAATRRSPPKSQWPIGATSESMVKEFIGANVADALSTAGALPAGGVEANPLISAAIDSIGLEATLILKVVAAVAIGLILIKFGKSHWLKWPTAIIAIAAISNTIQIFVL